MNIAIYTMRAIAELLTEPLSLFMLFILATILYNQNKKISNMQKMIIGQKIDSAFELTISQIVIGIFAGALVSIALSYIGVVFYENSMIYLVFFISMLFMFIDPRYVCFSYSGAVLGMTSFLLTEASKLLNIPNMDPFKIDIAALMSMVAIFHLMEGILVMVDGKRGAIPVFTNKDDKIVGGFVFKRYWAVPIALLFLVTSKGLIDSSTVSIPTPNWWPLIKGSISSKVLKTAVVSMIPFYGILGYSSTTFTKSKQEKSISSGLYLIGYGAILLAISQLIVFGVIFKILVLIFAPFGHELMLNYQKHREINDKPKYVSDGEGIMVLEVCPNSTARDMKIKSGDTILEINSNVICSEQDLLINLQNSTRLLAIKVKRENGNIEEMDNKEYNRQRKLGIVYVPKKIPGNSQVVKINESRFKGVLDKIINKNPKEKQEKKDDDDDEKKQQ